MTYPQVKIQEIIDGPRPVRPRSLARIAGVGVSQKGKYGSFILLSGDESLEDKIGRTTHEGSVGMQAAFDEGGSSDAGFVRVMGAAKAARAVFNVAGTGTVEDTVTLVVTQGVATYTFEATLANGEGALSLADELVNLVNDDADCPVMAVADGSVAGNVLLIAKTTGAAGNDIAYAVAEGAAAPDDLTFLNAAANLQGGYDGPTAAEVMLPTVTLMAASEGVEAGNISYRFVPGQKAGTVELQLEDLNTKKTEKHILSFTADDLVNGVELLKLRSSKLVRGYFTGNLAAVVLPTGSGTLSGARDGSPVEDADYLTAIGVLAKSQAHVIFAPGQTSSAVRAALLAQAENSTILGGLRIAVLNAPKGLTVDEAAAGAADPAVGPAAGINSGSAVMVAGWCTYAGQPRLPELSVSPDGFYAGHLAATPMHVSPAARSSSPYFRSIVAVDTESNEAAFAAYTDARLEAIVLDPATGGFHCLNGRTLASDEAMYYVCIRRMANQIRTDIYFASQALKSEPKSQSLLDSIVGMVNSYLGGRAAIGQIQSGSVESIKKTGTGVRCDFRWHPVYPADEIDYGMHRLAVDV